MKTNGLLRKVLNNTFISSSMAYVFSSFLVKGISFLSAPIYTRLMGTADYGIVDNFQTWGQFLSCFLCLQVSASILSAKMNVAQDRVEEYVSNISLFSLFCALFFSSLLLLFSKQFVSLTKINNKYIPYLLGFSFSTCCINQFTNYLISTSKIKYKVFFSIVSTLFIVISTLLVVFFSQNKSEGRIIGTAISNGIIALSVLVLIFLRGSPKRHCFKRDISFALSFGVPLIPHLLANLINGNSDRVYIIRILGESDAGIYSVAYSIGLIALTFASAAGDAWTPWYFEKSRKKEKTEISKYFIMYSSTIAMFFFGVSLLAPELMKIMAPLEYYSGVTCIPFVALGVFFLYIYRFSLNYEQLQGNTKYVAPATIITALVNLFLNGVLIPKMGIDGAAIATTLSYVLLFICHEIVARKIIKGYDINLGDYKYSFIIAISGFVLSIVLRNQNLIRYLILLVFCFLFLLFLKHSYVYLEE